MECKKILLWLILFIQTKTTDRVIYKMNALRNRVMMIDDFATNTKNETIFLLKENLGFIFNFKIEEVILDFKIVEHTKNSYFNSQKFAQEVYKFKEDVSRKEISSEILNKSSCKNNKQDKSNLVYQEFITEEPSLDSNGCVNKTENNILMTNLSVSEQSNSLQKLYSTNNVNRSITEDAFSHCPSSFYEEKLCIFEKIFDFDSFFANLMHDIDKQTYETWQENWSTQKFDLKSSFSQAISKKSNYSEIFIVTLNFDAKKKY